MSKQPQGTNQALVRAASGVGNKYTPPQKSNPKDPTLIIPKKS